MKYIYTHTYTRTRTRVHTHIYCILLLITCHHVTVLYNACVTSRLKMKCYHALRLEFVRRIRRYSFVFQIIEENKFNYLWYIVCYIQLCFYLCYVYFDGFVLARENVFIFSSAVYAKREGNKELNLPWLALLLVFFIICFHSFYLWFLVKWDSFIIYVMSHKQRNTTRIS